MYSMRSATEFGEQKLQRSKSRRPANGFWWSRKASKRKRAGFSDGNQQPADPSQDLRKQPGELHARSPPPPKRESDILLNGHWYAVSIDRGCGRVDSEWTPDGPGVMVMKFGQSLSQGTGSDGYCWTTNTNKYRFLQ